jgi:gluconate 5-dehydrogenase
MAFGLAEAGAAVVVCGRRVERCEAVADHLRELGMQSLSVRCDVTDAAQVEALVDTTVEQFGSLDVLVNSAGTTWAAPPEEFPLEAWHTVLDVNLTGTFLCCRTAGRVMLEQGRGKIVNIAGIAALRGSDPTVRQAVGYSASKGGVVAFTRDLACQWARRGIHVNAIAPGTFPTEIMEQVLGGGDGGERGGIPLSPGGNDEYLKGVVVFLSSAGSDFITGQVLVVDGGRSIARWTNLLG